MAYSHGRVFVLKKDIVDTNIIENTTLPGSLNILGTEDTNNGKVESNSTIKKTSPTINSVDLPIPTPVSTLAPTSSPTSTLNTYYIYVTPVPTPVLLPTSTPRPDYSVELTYLMNKYDATKIYYANQISTLENEKQAEIKRAAGQIIASYAARGLSGGIVDSAVINSTNQITSSYDSKIKNLEYERDNILKDLEYQINRLGY
ncbi:MAG: hypothetical protein ABH819_03070 [Patescibacteria group bacterium]